MKDPVKDLAEAIHRLTVILDDETDAIRNPDRGDLEATLKAKIAASSRLHDGLQALRDDRPADDEATTTTTNRALAALRGDMVNLRKTAQRNATTIAQSQRGVHRLFQLIADRQQAESDAELPIYGPTADCGAVLRRRSAKDAMPRPAALDATL